MLWQPSYQPRSPVPSESRSRNWTPTGAYAWYAADYSDSMYTDLAATTQAEGGQRVAVWQDLIGSADAISETIPVETADLPLLSSHNGREGLQFGYYKENEFIRLHVPGLGSWSSGQTELAVVVMGTMLDRPYGNFASSTFYASVGSSADRFFRFSLVMFDPIADSGAFRTGFRRLDTDSTETTDGGQVVIQEPFAHLGIHNHNEDYVAQYVNSKTETTRTTPFQGVGPTSATASNVVRIGVADIDGTSLEYRGLIHEIVVYQTVPSQSEIDGMMQHASDYWGVTLLP